MADSVRSLDRSRRDRGSPNPSPESMTASPGERKYRSDRSRPARGDPARRLPAGSRLPGENDIMRDHGSVARMTARQALAMLISEGRAEARKGSGVYVREFRPVVRRPHPARADLG